MKNILYPILLFFLISPSQAEVLINEFKKLNDGNLIKNYVYNNEDYFFSLASTKITQKSNKNILSTKTTIKALKQFKTFYKKNFIGSKEISNNDKISVKKVQKIQNRPFKDYYIVVLAIPKKSIIYLKK
mgnify:FL=1